MPPPPPPRPALAILALALNDLPGTGASLRVTFRRPCVRAPRWSRTFRVTAHVDGLCVTSQHAPPVRPASCAAALAYMSRDGRLALESVDILAPGRPPFLWFGPAAGIVDSGEARHAAARVIQRQFLERRQTCARFFRAFAAAATETHGAGRLHFPRFPIISM